MKHWLTALIFIVLMSACIHGAPLAPENLTLTVAIIADSGNHNEYILIVNGVVAFKTLDGFKNYLKDVPNISTLTYAPGCCRFGSEPLSSESEMKKLKDLCASKSIKFVLVRSG